MTAQVSAIAKKCRRALRNETGIKFTLDELRALVDIGSYDLIMQAEAEEIRQTWQKTPPRSLSGNTGSTKGGTAKPEMSGKLPDIPPSIGHSSIDRTRVGTGKRGAVRVELGVRRIIK